MTGSTRLQYDLLVSDLERIAGAAPPDGTPPRWSPLSHTLIYGSATGLLVDPPITSGQTDALGDWVAGHDVTLRYVYITHPHSDHWLGTAQLLKRFPDATVLASPGVLARIAADTATGSAPPLWRTLFGDRLPRDPVSFAGEAFPASGIEIDGEEIHAQEVGHSDTDESTILHVPSLDLVAAGDVIYNNVHQYLAEIRDGGLEGWHRGIDAVQALKPQVVIAGHKDSGRPDDPGNIDETRRYLDTVTPLLDRGLSRSEFYTKTLELYPDRVNPYTVWLSATQLIGE